MSSFYGSLESSARTLEDSLTKANAIILFGA